MEEVAIQKYTLFAYWVVLHAEALWDGHDGLRYHMHVALERIKLKDGVMFAYGF